MIRRKKKRFKKAALVVIPVVVISALSLASIAYRPRASETTFAFENYYDTNEYSNNSEEYDTINIDEMMEDNPNVADFEHTEEPVIITDHESVELDTDPESITVLVNKELSLPTNYVPTDLVVPNVKFSITYYDEKKLMRKEAGEALESLFFAAEQEGYTLYGISAYRSYKRQYDIFTNNIKKKGFEHTLKYSAKPGYSEHQTGLAIDVSVKSIKYQLDSSFADTPEGIWLENNAYKYGYIIRFPEDKTQITGYSYEPWHIRYVGISLATYLYENSLTLEEYYSFEPSIDFNNEISYDNLDDFGINIADVIEPTPTVVIKPTEDITEDEELTDDQEDTDGTEDDTDSSADDNSQKGTDSKNDSGTKKGNDSKDNEETDTTDNQGDSKEDSTTDESGEDDLEEGETLPNSDSTSGSNGSVSVTPTPTKMPSITPSTTPPVSTTVTPTPTKTPTVTPTPTKVPTATGGVITPTVTPSTMPTP